MGRTHGKDTTFARAADNMGFVPKEDILEHCKVLSCVCVCVLLLLLEEQGINRTFYETLS